MHNYIGLLAVLYETKSMKPRAYIIFECTVQRLISIWTQESIVLAQVSWHPPILTPEGGLVSQAYHAYGTLLPTGYVHSKRSMWGMHGSCDPRLCTIHLLCSLSFYIISQTARLDWTAGLIKNMVFFVNTILRADT